MPTSSEAHEPDRPVETASRTYAPTVHVIIMDGTMSSLDPGVETNAGLAFKLTSEMGAAVSVHYEKGLQWPSLRRAFGVLMGRGINHQIRRAYGYLASRYRPGDKIFLLGLSIAEQKGTVSRSKIGQAALAKGQTG